MHKTLSMTDPLRPHHRPTLLLATQMSWILLFALAIHSPSASAFQLDSQWTHTAIDGSGIQQGDPTHITWGLVPDGTRMLDGGSSSLIGALDATFGDTATGNDYTQRSWFSDFQTAFDRWGDVSGLTFVYEPYDDGAITSSTLASGFRGQRADMRIGGTTIAEEGVLARNYYPDYGGDMTINTSQLSFFASDPVAFQNTLMHEAGHGVGIQHVESYDFLDPDTQMKSGGGEFLMEPVLNTSFFGPQFDDILSVHRFHGDVHEKSNGGSGNDIYQNATSLGVIANGTTAMIGTDAQPDPNTLLPLPVEEENVDFVSIDGLGDADFFSFEIIHPAETDIILTPLGPVYPEGPQLFPPAPALSSLDTSALNNLSVQLFDSTGVVQLASDNSGLTGETDSILGFTPTSPGTYYVRVEGEFDTVQMYQLSVSVGESSILPCDADEDGDCEQDDIDALYTAIGDSNLAFDLNGDGLVNADDIDTWLAEASQPENTYNPDGNTFIMGDTDLDGKVDSSDLGRLLNNFNASTQLTWSQGNLNADDAVNSVDLGILLNGFGFESALATQSVPEPSGVSVLLGALCSIVGMSRRRRTSRGGPRCQR